MCSTLSQAASGPPIEFTLICDYVKNTVTLQGGFGMRLIWLPSMAVGIEQIDDQHRALLEMAGVICAADAAAIPVLLDTCTERLLAHFATEECILRRLGYAHMVAHARIHSLFRAALGQRRALVADAPAGFDRGEFADWISKWLIDQMLREDIQYKSFVAERRGRQHARCRCLDEGVEPGGDCLYCVSPA